MANLEIKLSANKRQPYLRHRVVGRVGDGGLTTINVQLLEEDEITPFVINLNGTLKFVGEVSNGNYTEGEPEIIDSTNGLISYTFTKSNFSTSHQFKQAYFEYVDPNGKKVTFQNFIIDVLERVDINSEQAKYYISSLEKLQSEMQTTFNQFISDKQVQYDQIYSKYNELVRLINESDKQVNDRIDQTNQQIGELRNDMKLSEAWAWSADGTDRFTNVKPGENLIKYSKFTINTPLWRFSSSSSEATGGKSDGYFWIEDYTATERLWKQWEITFNDTNEQKESFLKFIASQNKNATLSFNALVKDETSVDPRLIVARVRDDTGRDIANFGISAESLSEEFQRFSIQFKIPEDAGNITNFRVLLVYHGFGHCEFSKPKLEFEKYTIYTPAPSEDYENAYPQYRGLALLPSDLPDDYSWDVTPEYTEKGLNDTVSLTEPQSIEGLKNFEDGIQSKGKSVLTSDDNKYEVVTLTVTNGNTGSAKLYREGKTVSIYFVALNGKSSGGNDSTILTIPEGYRPPISFEQLVGSIDRSTLNSAQLSIGADGAIKWRRNSSYGSDYTFAITYTI
ncbi:BppU family phage baseplate upper protein [Enterococcus faecium]|uniref:BppU family phage baseplate upper protein n=1 Tax=Enterococcus faecium TaxID=1352 RepID=UPI002A2F55A5|nr:BppU family phage baseplate upper protein [Enterococcus faecium]MDB7510101.1 BppU family phage baseplate upper protein [Enterococcus faecium]MDB7517778.1 BppU family phage baseplate upper protein [Enterococcus faecium]